MQANVFVSTINFRPSLTFLCEVRAYHSVESGKCSCWWKCPEVTNALAYTSAKSFIVQAPDLQTDTKKAM